MKATLILCDAAQVDPAGKVHILGAGWTVVMVAGGFGTAIVPDSLQSLQLPNVVYRPLITRANILIELHCAYRKDERSPLLKALLQTVHEYRRKNHAATGARAGKTRLPADPAPRSGQASLPRSRRPATAIKP